MNGSARTNRLLVRRPFARSGLVDRHGCGAGASCADLWRAQSTAGSVRYLEPLALLVEGDWCPPIQKLANLWLGTSGTAARWREQGASVPHGDRGHWWLRRWPTSRLNTQPRSRASAKAGWCGKV